MKFVDNIKVFLGNRAIRKKLKRTDRKVRSCNLKDAKKIGILFDATHTVSFEIVRQLVKDLTSEKQKVLALGYVDSKQMIDHYLYRKGFEFFTHTHLNWYGKPDSESVTNFIEETFDLLIYVSLEEFYPLKYVLALSKATFKAGRLDLQQDYLDLMIDIEKEKEAMSDLKKELAKEQPGQKKHLTDYDKVANQKASIEIQTNFLINQLVHYLNQIKN